MFKRFISGGMAALASLFIIGLLVLHKNPPASPAPSAPLKVSIKALRAGKNITAKKSSAHPVYTKPSTKDTDIDYITMATLVVPFNCVWVYGMYKQIKQAIKEFYENLQQEENLWTKVYVPFSLVLGTLVFIACNVYLVYYSLGFIRSQFIKYKVHKLQKEAEALYTPFAATLADHYDEQRTLLAQREKYVLKNGIPINYQTEDTSTPYSDAHIAQVFGGKKDNRYKKHKEAMDKFNESLAAVARKIEEKEKQQQVFWKDFDAIKQDVKKTIEGIGGKWTFFVPYVLAKFLLNVAGFDRLNLIAYLGAVPSGNKKVNKKIKKCWARILFVTVAFMVEFFAEQYIYNANPGANKSKRFFRKALVLDTICHPVFMLTIPMVYDFSFMVMPFVSRLKHKLPILLLPNVDLSHSHQGTPMGYDFSFMVIDFVSRLKHKLPILLLFSIGLYYLLHVCNKVALLFEAPYQSYSAKTLQKMRNTLAISTQTSNDSSPFCPKLRFAYCFVLGWMYA